MMPPPGERTLKADGTCNACSKMAAGNFMPCFSCEKQWHVVDCENGSDNLATTTFLNMWKGWNTNGTYKCIIFICPSCRDAKNLQRDIVNSNRMTVMQENLDSVQSDILEMKNMLTKSQENTGRPVSVPTYAETVKSSNSVIILKRDGHEHAVDRGVIKAAALSSRAGITSAFKNKNGDNVIICDNEDGKTRLEANLREKVKDRAIIAPAPRQPTIRITGMDENHTADIIKELVKDQNRDKGIDIHESNFKVLFIRPHAKNADLFQAIVRVSNEICTAIQNCGDKLFVGLTLCKVYDHFHIRRCNKCQGYNHFHDNCEKEPNCGKCAEPHETKDCPVTNEELIAKCANCVANKYTDVNHKAWDPYCKSFLAAQKKLEQTIGFYKGKN